MRTLRLRERKRPSPAHTARERPSWAWNSGLNTFLISAPEDPPRPLGLTSQSQRQDLRGNDDRRTGDMLGRTAGWDTKGETTVASVKLRHIPSLPPPPQVCPSSPRAWERDTPPGLLPSHMPCTPLQCMELGTKRGWRPDMKLPSPTPTPQSPSCVSLHLPPTRSGLRSPHL